MRGRHILGLALLFLAAAILGRPASRQQELRVLITARNMLETGDFFHPEFQNQPRFRKPPLAYWLAAAGMGISGIRDEAWAARIPFAAAALGCLALLLRLGGPAGPWAALLFFFSFAFWRYAPLAETDILQLFGILLTFSAFRSRSGWLCGLGMSIAILAKGPAGIAIPLATALLSSATPGGGGRRKTNEDGGGRRKTNEDGGGRRPTPLRTPHSALSFLLPCLSLPLLTGGGWLLFLYLDPGARAALTQELSDTFVRSPHTNPWPYYFYTLPLLFLPSILLVLRVLPKRPFRLPPLSPNLLWFLATFLLLTLVDSKQRHYALLLMPPACLLLGERLHKRGPTPRLTYALPLALFLAAAEIPRAHFDPANRHAAFLREARPDIAAASTLHVVGINSAFFDFHLGRHVENTDSARNAITRARPGDAVFVLQKRKHLDADALPQPPLAADDDAHWIRRRYASLLPLP